MIPMISSLCQGSLGVCQLGRTWWKALSRAVDLLDPDYPDNSGGLDTWCLQAMELDVDAVYADLSAKGVRFTAPPEHQPWGGTQGTASDMEIQVNEILKLKKSLN